MPLQLNPIFPKFDPFKKVDAVKVVATMRTMGSTAQNRLGNYPPQAPNVDYRRTGTLGRRWTMRGPSTRGKDLIVEVGNKTTYAVWVQGPTKGSGRKQRKLFRQRGWRGVTEVGDAVVKKFDRPLRKALGLKG